MLGSAMLSVSFGSNFNQTKDTNMGGIVNKITGADKAQAAAEREAKKARQIQEGVARQEAAYRQEQENLQANMQSINDSAANATGTVIAGGTADLGDSDSTAMMNKRKRNGGLASAVGLNV
jgi:hypothetical protein